RRMCEMCLILFDVPLAELLFFFASRRRHTRSKRDWSSDVCSSDLDYFYDNLSIDSLCHITTYNPTDTTTVRDTVQYKLHYPAARSEERRVGKARRCTSWPAPSTQKRSSAEHMIRSAEAIQLLCRRT